MLLLAEVNSIPEEGGRKRNLVGPSSSASGKMVLKLLVDVIIIHVGPTIVDVRGFGLELVSRSTF